MVSGPTDMSTVAGEQMAASRVGTLARQPMIGLAGLGFVAVVFLLLGVLPSPMRSLTVLGPLTIFMLPTFIMISLWWNGRPAVDRFAQPVAGLVNLLLIAVGAVLSTWIGQAIVGQADLEGIFTQPSPEPGGPFVTYPWTIPLAAATIVAMLQLTLVNEQWPLSRLRPIVGGLAALPVAWLVALVFYHALANWDSVPAPALAAIGVNNPGGPVDALNLTGWLLSVAVWQAILFVLLRGQPFAAIRSRPMRLLVQNLTVVGIGWLWYLIQKDMFDWAVPRIIAIAGVGVAASFIVGMLFEAWPSRNLLSPALTAMGLFATMVAVVVLEFFGLRALGNAIETWTPQAPVELWVGTVGLNYLAGAVVLHYAIFGRWPFAPPEPPPPPPPA